MSFQQQLTSILLLVIVALLCNQQAQAFEEPSASVREAIKAAIVDEDVIVMQAEMAWGAQEMRRYKSLRGDWPVRSAVSGQEDAAAEEERLFRGGGGLREQNTSPQNDYWNYLVSMF